MNSLRLIFTLALGLYAGSVLAQTSPSGANGRASGAVTVPAPTSGSYFTNRPLKYTANERRAVKMSHQIESRKLGAHRGVDGSVSYVFGEATPAIVCAPLRICALALEPGENVKDVLIGDSARWTVAPAVSGDGESMRTYAVIKTQDVGLATNLIITTDRRTYHLTLKSAKRDHMPLISFTYPQNARSAWAALKAQHASKRKINKKQADANARKSIPGIGMRIEDLNFAYSVRGNAPWKPQRVFDDGVRTYIELPSQVVALEAPIILIPRNGKNEMVNYRLRGNRYVVDRLASSLVMVQGKGFEQERVHIEATGKHRQTALNAEVLEGAN